MGLAATVASQAFDYKKLSLFTRKFVRFKHSDNHHQFRIDTVITKYRQYVNIVTLGFLKLYLKKKCTNFLLLVSFQENKRSKICAICISVNMTDYDISPFYVLYAIFAEGNNK